MWSTPANSKYHVVWCPKYRLQVLVKGIDARLKETIIQTTLEFQAGLIDLEDLPGHIDLLVEVDPQFGIHQLVKQIKGRSCRLLRQAGVLPGNGVVISGTSCL